jgi:hypothetical protein
MLNLLMHHVTSRLEKVKGSFRGSLGLKVKVKESHNRPGVAQRVPGV